MTIYGIAITAAIAVAMPLAAHAEDEWTSGRAQGGAAATATTAAGTGAPMFTQRGVLVDEGHTPVEGAAPAGRSMHTPAAQREATDLRRAPDGDRDRLYTGG